MQYNMTPDDVYATPIEELGLRVRTYNCLKRSGINKVGQLLSRQKKEIFSIRNLTPEDYEEIRAQLITRGLMSPTQLLGPFAEGDEEQKDEEQL
jgi:DNA-directed RNA polymerase subunit alpha